MAEEAGETGVFWIDPKFRGILPLDGFHLSRSLARTIRNTRMRVTLDTDFTGVVDGCADRDTTWINNQIFDGYMKLYQLGYAHSIEVWDGDALVGGVYGVTLGRAFFGESMFSRRTDASKVALAYLVDRLRQGGFQLFDTQFLTPHLASLGAIEVPRSVYHALLRQALALPASFTCAGPVPSPDQLLQRSTQTS
jgi:leucyl/phenylalanyl-tRNA--protein transferase